MKFTIVVLAVVAAASAQTAFNPFVPSQYNPYNPYQQLGRYTTPRPYRPYVSSTPAPLVPFASSTFAPPTYAPPVLVKVTNVDSRNANIIKYENEINPDGSYSYLYETDNGIAAQETGVPRNFGGNPPVIPDVAQGSYSYTSPEGIPVSITYIADENGFQAQGNVIPTAPPTPPQILRALEYNARNAPKK